MQNSWQEGYHDIEKRLADHFKTVVDHHLKFPVVAGMGGGVHIYKPLHCNKENKEPWNWTGWIPRPKIWLYQGHFFTNRWAQFTIYIVVITKPWPFENKFTLNLSFYRS
jgi:hypothetical protein